MKLHLFYKVLKVSIDILDFFQKKFCVFFQILSCSILRSLFGNPDQSAEAAAGKQQKEGREKKK